jgi:DNA (cytosine-5)-methyltransferase 1
MILENHPADSRVKICEDGVFQTLSSRMGTGGGNVPMVMEPYISSKGSENLAVNYTVRRLTPLECERLQGFPDNWTNIGEWIDSKGKKHKDADSPRYKALGNSIALPFWQWMADRMVKVLKEDGVQLPTMASLFDGIGGFPLVYSRCGCKPIWASEIEEFPMAVTKIRFPEVDYESSNHNKRE